MSAVLPVWSGFDADRELDLAPDTPMEVRQASAVGMIGHFDTALSAREQSGHANLSTVVELCAWLLDVEEVRTAVFDLMKIRGADEEVVKKLDTGYKQSSEQGAGELRNVLGDRDKKVPPDFDTCRAMFESLFILLDEDSTPMKKSGALGTESLEDAVRNVRRDTNRLLQSFLVMGPDPRGWCDPDRFKKGEEARAKERAEKLKRVQADAQAAREKKAAAAAAAAPKPADSSDGEFFDAESSDNDEPPPPAPSELSRMFATRPGEDFANPYITAPAEDVMAIVMRRPEERQAAPVGGDEEDAILSMRAGFNTEEEKAAAAEAAAAEAAAAEAAAAERKQLEDEAAAKRAETERENAVREALGLVPMATCDTAAKRVELEQIGDALYRAFKRMSIDGAKEADLLGAGWNASTTISPLLRTRTPDDWEAQLDTSLEGGIGNGNTSYRKSGDELQTPEFLANTLNSGFAANEAKLRFAFSHSSVGAIEDHVYVEFAMLRGLCALRGPHQAISNTDVLMYNYPRGRLRRREALEALEAMKARPGVTTALQNEARRMYDDFEFYEDGTRPEFAGPVLLQESEARGGAAALTFTDESVGGVPVERPTGQEPAMEVAWLPAALNDGRRDALFTSKSVALAKAACLETLLTYLKGVLEKAEALRERGQLPIASMRTIASAIAATKLRQLESLAIVASSVHGGNVRPHAYDSKAPGGGPTPMLTPDENPNEVCITRPVLHCQEGDGEGAKFRMLYPVGAGVGRLVASDDPPAPRPKPPDAKSFNVFDVQVRGCKGTAETVDAARMTQWLRNGLDTSPDDDTLSFGMYVGATTQEQPWQRAPKREQREFGEARGVSPESVTVERLRSAINNGMDALRNLEGLSHEKQLLANLKRRGSDERKQLFGIYDGEHDKPPSQQRVTMEVAARDRRAAVWEQALRKLNVSHDRLLDFLKTLSGTVNEAVDWVLEQGDPELLEAQKKVSQRRKEISQRTMQFQSRITEAVLNAALKDSKLQLGLTSADKGLVVLDQEERENFKTLASGASGRAFFDASVALQQISDSTAAPPSIKDVLQNLQEVGTAFYGFLNSEFALNDPVARQSPEALADSSNSYCVRLKPEAYSAIKMAHQDVVREVNHHYHHMARVPSLWELVEGRGLQLRTTFANLCALKLKHLQFTSGSLAAYAGRDVRLGNQMEYKRIRDRMVHVICEYVVAVPRPDFLHPGARERHFGGTTGREDSDACGKRPARLGEPVDATDEPVEDGSSAKRQRLEAEEKARGLARGRLKQLKVDTAALDRVIDLNTKQQRQREKLFGKVVNELPGLGGWVAPLPLDEPIDTKSEAAIAKQIRERMNKKSNSFLNRMASSLRDKVEKTFFLPSTDKGVDSCSVAFAHNPVAVAICRQLEKKGFVRQLDASNGKTRYPLPIPKPYIKGRPQLHNAVEIDEPQLVKDLGRKLNQEEVSEALNEIFGLPGMKDVNGEAWNKLPGGDSSARFYIRRYIKHVVDEQLEAEAEACWLFQTIANLRAKVGKPNWRNVLLAALTLVLLWQVFTRGTILWRLLATGADKLAGIPGAISTWWNKEPSMTPAGLAQTIGAMGETVQNAATYLFSFGFDPKQTEENPAATNAFLRFVNGMAFPKNGSTAAPMDVDVAGGIRVPGAGAAALAIGMSVGGSATVNASGSGGAPVAIGRPVASEKREGEWVGHGGVQRLEDEIDRAAAPRSQWRTWNQLTADAANGKGHRLGEQRKHAGGWGTNMEGSS